MRGISAIVTFYNGVSSLKMCLDILQTSLSKEKEYEIIVVNDNPSMDINFLTKEYPILLLNLQYNMGYAGACNTAVKKAKYDTLLFMDCDIYPSGNWLDSMKKTYQDINEKGCVSATIYETNSGNLFGYGMGVYEVDILLFLRHGKPSEFSEKDKNVPIVSSGCMMMNKDIYVALGGQDELCMNIHCDVDLAFRVLKAGYTNRMCADAKVFHRGQISGPIRTVPFRQDVKAYLFKKWGNELYQLCNTEHYLQELWLSGNSKNIRNTDVILINFSSSLYYKQYINRFSEFFDFKILQFYDIKNITGASQIYLQEVVPWDICRLNIPILYFADDYRLLHNNYFWFANRNCEDIILDKNGNLIYSSDSLIRNC